MKLSDFLRAEFQDWMGAIGVTITYDPPKPAKLTRPFAHRDNVEPTDEQRLPVPDAWTEQLKSNVFHRALMNAAGKKMPRT